MDIQSLKKYGEFKCIAEKCIDSCCRGWSIQVDEEIYNKYSNSESCRDMLKNIGEAMVDGKKIYRMKLIDDDKCPFLRNDLCGIYLDMGEEYQPEACIKFPRVIREDFGRKQYSLTLSCPEAARILLLDESTVEFEIYSDDTQTPDKKSGFMGLDYDIVYTLQEFAICVLQARNVSLFDRLVFLGIFLDNAGKTLETENGQAALMQDCESHLNYLIGRFGKIFTFPQNEENKEIRKKLIEAFLPLLKTMFSVVVGGKQNPDFLKKLEKLTAEFDTLTADKISGAYYRLFKPYYAMHEAVFENYLVLDLFNTDFPRTHKDLASATKAFFLRYILFWLFISALYIDEKYISGSDVVDAAYYFTKRVTHNKSCNQYVEENGGALTLELFVNLLQMSEE